jgi:hypothetical protein
MILKDFPQFNESIFVKIRKQLHLIAQLIGKVRETFVKPIAKNDNLWLSVVDKGFCTPPIVEFNELEVGCNLETLKIEAANNKSQYDTIEINGKTIEDLGNDLINKLNDFEVIVKQDDYQSTTFPIPIFMGRSLGTRCLKFNSKRHIRYFNSIIQLSLVIKGVSFKDSRGCENSGLSLAAPL